MRGGWKLLVALALLAALFAALWGRQGTPEGEPGKGGVQAPVVAPDSTARPDRERPGREREERPGTSSK